MILAAALLALTALPVRAAPEPLAPAPVPNIDAGRVAPADRAGSSSSAGNQAPFSAGPTNEVAGTGQATPQNLPDTTRETAPSPNLSK